MTKLVNRAKMTTSSTGTGSPITLGSAVDGYQTFAAAGVANGDVVRYVIEDGDAWEIGTGTYTSTGTTLSRTVLESSNADAALNLTGSATVFVTAAAADILQPGDNISSLTNDAGYTTNIGDITGVTAGAGLAGGGTSGTVTVSHADTSTQGSVNNSGRTFIQDITLDTYGHVTGIVSATDADTFTGTVTSVATGGGLTGGTITTSGTISHADTSSQASVNNSGRTYIQDVTLDEYGHVTGLTSATETVVNTTSLPIENSAGTAQFTATDTTGLQFAATGASSVAFDAVNQRVTISSTDTNTTYSAGTGLSLVGTTFNNTAPDQIVSLTGGGATSISGTYPNFTISSTDTNTTYSAGTALDLSGTTFNVDLSELATSTTDGDGDFFVVVDSLNAQRKLTKGNINISGFNNDAGYTSNVGDITGVTAGAGLTGGGTSGSVTLSHADTSSQGSVNNSGRTYIQDITLDTYGHITGITSATETVVNTTSLPIENSAGTAQFTATDATGLQFAASGASSVSFDAVNQRVTISSTDTNTTYSAGNGISLSGTTFSVAAGGGLTQDASGLSHADTSAQASVNNSGSVYIQDITLDTYGHVTGITSTTVPASAPSTAQVLSATAGASAGDVGTYAFHRRYVNVATTGPNDTVAGSSLGYNNGFGQGTNSISRVTPAGTWRHMGRSNGSTSGDNIPTTATLWLRIS